MLLPWIIAGISLTGGIISGIGDILSGQQKAREAEFEAQKTGEQIPVLQSQLAVQRATLSDIAADRQAATEQYQIQQQAFQVKQQELGIRETQTARAGATALGSSAARAAAGGLAGASPLRRAQAIQRQIGESMALLGGERTLLAGQERSAALQYQDVLRGLNLKTLATEADITGTQYNIRWAGLESEELTRKADWYKTYGWLSAVGDILTGGGAALGAF